jgi:hypothetical protein
LRGTAFCAGADQDFTALVELDWPVTGEVTDADLGALQILQDRDRAIHPLRDPTDDGDPALVVLSPSVGKVEPHHVYTGG